MRYDEEKARKFHDRLESKYPEGSAGRLGWTYEYFDYDGIAKFFQSQINRNHKTIIETGSGYGHIAYRLSQLYPNMSVTGVEINEKFLEYAMRTYSSNNLKFIQGSFFDFLAKEEKFDTLVNCGSAFEYCSEENWDRLWYLICNKFQSFMYLFDCRGKIPETQWFADKMEELKGQYPTLNYSVNFKMSEVKAIFGMTRKDKLRTFPFSRYMYFHKNSDRQWSGSIPQER